MNESCLALNILSLLDKLIVGVVAIVAAWLGQWLSHKWSQEREQQKLRQEKAADLIKGIYRHQNWMHTKCTRPRYIAPELGEPNPIGEVEVLCRVYFPLLQEERLHFINSVMQLEKRLLDLLQQQTTLAISTDDEFVAKFLTHYQLACEILMRAAADQVLSK